jgi:hypothetical protein
VTQNLLISGLIQINKATWSRLIGSNDALCEAIARLAIRPVQIWAPAGRKVVKGGRQAHMARGIHGLPKVSPRPTMPNPSTPRRTTHDTALRPFQGWPACRAGRAAYGCLLPPWIPHSIRAWCTLFYFTIK